MAQSKLTLSMEPEYIEMAKSYAAEKNISVSKLVKNLIQEVSKKRDINDAFLEKLRNEPVSPKVQALTGIIKGKYPDNFDYRDAYREHLSKKHGL